MALAIQCSALAKEYRTGRQVRALDSVDLQVEEGELFGLLGPNGAGKTTLVRILATLLRATHGRAWVGGYDVAQDEQQVRRIIGYAGQDSERSAYFRLTARENLLYFGHALHGVPIHDAQERIDAFAGAIGFTDQLAKPFSTLSGGQKQLVIVMRALLHHPKVVFMDEPSKSLDPVTAHRVRDFLVNYGRQHRMTILLTTHNMDEAEDICDRMAFINQGCVQFVGTPLAFRRSATVQEAVEVTIQDGAAIVERLSKLPGVTRSTTEGAVRLYCDDSFALLKEVVGVLDRSGARASVRMVEPSLEEAFSALAKVGEERTDG
ncbi:MAG: ABC transporter ATP-binding protein [Anaerolineae bacterium]|nr:ABC transporter ATP-binding protein [Anaerolineae bacterium]